MAKKKNDKLNYEIAQKELEQILEDLQEGEIQLDELSLKVKRASELVRFCKEKLRNTKSDVEQLFDQDEEE